MMYLNKYLQQQQQQQHSRVQTIMRLLLLINRSDVLSLLLKNTHHIRNADYINITLTTTGLSILSILENL